MVDLIRNILTNPVWTIITTIFLWIVFFLLFTYLNLSVTNWKRLEYIWIFTGFFGLISAISQNNKDFKIEERERLKQDIKLDISHFNASEKYACLKDLKRLPSPIDSDLQLSDQSKVCKWSGDFKINIDTLEGIPDYLDSTSLKSIDLKTNCMNFFVKDATLFINEINSKITLYHGYSEEINSNVGKF